MINKILNRIKSFFKKEDYQITWGNDDLAERYVEQQKKKLVERYKRS